MCWEQYISILYSALLKQKPTEVGDVMLSLSYLPTAERLTVVIVKARKLKWAYSKANGDCFVKVYLLQNGKKISKKKTTLKKDEKTPIFNEAMIFSIPAAHLEVRKTRWLTNKFFILDDYHYYL